MSLPVRSLASVAAVVGALWFAGCSHAQASRPAPSLDWSAYVRSCATVDGGPGLGTIVAGVFRADVTGDGRSEWLVVSECSSKTSRWPQQVEVFEPGATPRRIGTLLEGDPAAPRDVGVTMEGPLLVLTGRGLTPDAPACCPDLNVRRVYAFNGGRFTLVDSTDTPG